MSFLRPPGALPESAFLKTCIHCGQCAAACPYGSVRMLETFGPENRIVTESLAAVLTREDFPVDDAFKQVFLFPEN